MTVRSYEEITADMQSGHTFSSMGDYENWAQHWCNRCVHEDGCPIVDAALIKSGSRPAEWGPVDGPFICSEFRPAP